MEMGISLLALNTWTLRYSARDLVCSTPQELHVDYTTRVLQFPETLVPTVAYTAGQLLYS